MAKIIEKSSALLLPVLVANSQRDLLRAIAIALLATPLPVVAAPAPMTLGGIVRTGLPGCDNATPVRAPSGAVYSNVSDCSVGNSGRISTGWVKVDPVVGWVSSNLTATAGMAQRAQALRRGRRGRHALPARAQPHHLRRHAARPERERRPAERDLGRQPRLRLGQLRPGKPRRLPVHLLRDAPTAYGTADRVDLARVPKGSVTNLAAWQVFAGSSTAPSWVSWTNRAARRPVLAIPAGSTARTSAT